MAILKYNPQFLDAAERARLFGGRQHDLDELLRIVRSNVPRPRNQHVLVIGPRGMGKTMLLLRVVDEIRGDPALDGQWLPVVAPEETYCAGSVGEFWLEMVFSLARTTSDPRHEHAYERLKEEHDSPSSANDDRRLAAAALGYLQGVADQSGRRLLLVVENLHMILGEQLSDSDGWALREVLTGESRIMLLCSAASRFREIDDAAAPLFEQFVVHRLDPLDTDGCHEVWRRATGDDAPKRRIRALQILTGGNPRLLTILAGFAARRSLRELAGDLASLIDEHTDYLKMTTEALPQLERRVFVTLAEMWEWASASAVATNARVELNTASAQLGRLERRGAVASRRKGRGKQYRVAERLYCIYHLMRRRGGAAARSRTAVEFMAAYYEGPSLARTVGAIAQEALALASQERFEHFSRLSAVLKHQKGGQAHDAIVSRIPAALSSCPDPPRDLRRHLGLGPVGEEAGAPPPVDGSDRETWPAELRGIIELAERCRAEGRADDEAKALARADETLSTLAAGAGERRLRLIADVSATVSSRQANLGQRAEALASIARAVEIYEQLAAEWPAAFAQRLSQSRANRAALLLLGGFAADAERELAASLRDDGEILVARQMLGSLYVETGRTEEALACLAALAASTSEREARVRAAIALSLQLAARGKSGEALRAITSGALAPHVEPLTIALRRECGEDVGAPAEIDEIAEDLGKQIREAPAATGEPGVNRGLA